MEKLEIKSSKNKRNTVNYRYWIEMPQGKGKNTEKGQNVNLKKKMQRGNKCQKKKCQKKKCQKKTHHNPL